MDIVIKRAYEAPSESDGQRILVDRLWPRGISKDKAKLDAWDKEIAPSTELRERFHSGALDFAGLERAYREELAAQPEALEHLRALARHGRLSLIYGARDEVHNNAAILREVLLGR